MPHVLWHKVFHGLHQERMRGGTLPHNAGSKTYRIVARQQPALKADVHTGCAISTRCTGQYPRFSKTHSGKHATAQRQQGPQVLAKSTLSRGLLADFDWQDQVHVALEQRDQLLARCDANLADDCSTCAHHHLLELQNVRS